MATPTADRWLTQRTRSVRTRANGMSRAMSRWFGNYAGLWVAEATDALRTGGITRLQRLAETEPKTPRGVIKVVGVGDLRVLEAELMDLMRRYGLRQMSAAGQTAARSAGGKWSLPPSLAAEWNERLANKVVLLVQQTEVGVRDSIKQLVSEALLETPRPTSRELARRIARQWHGPGARRRGPEPWPGRGTTAERQQTADWARDQAALDAGGKENLFSFERANTIARTELAQAENAAIADSFTEVGITEVGWAAFPFNPSHDGKKNSRDHYRMRGKSITVAEMNGKDESKWFELPSGIMTPYPNWIRLPAGETVRCQCFLTPEG